ncbi:hypothetical protein HKCCE4037_14610 [Rhodobacterales bacterium HKCCE4037]|nr:hypothetical protein [Rhodobacterales bacterium HKCCE4037]
MFRNLSKTLSAGALALTLALTGITATATPAAANNHRNNGAEAAAIFGGLLLLYGLSQANNGNRHNPQVIQRHNPPVIRLNEPPRNHRVAPSQCFIEGHDNNGYYRGYRYRCMQNNVSAPHLLPQNCLRHVWTDRGQRTIYAGRCLANNGWTRG